MRLVLGGQGKGSKDESHHRGIPVRDKHRLGRANRKGRRAGLRFPVRFLMPVFQEPVERRDRSNIWMSYEGSTQCPRGDKREKERDRRVHGGKVTNNSTSSPFRGADSNLCEIFYAETDLPSSRTTTIGWSKGKPRTLLEFEDTFLRF